MKVAFVMRADALEKSGGDVIQINKYIEWGKRLNLYDGYLISNIFTDIRKYDVIHLTNIDRPVEAFWFFIKAMHLKKKIYISTIHHSYSEIEKYESIGRHGVLKLISSLLRFSHLEILRSIFRVLSKPALTLPTILAIIFGVHRAQKKILMNSRRIFVLSEKEIKDIVKDFDWSGDVNKFQIIRNGVDIKFENSIPVHKDIDLCIVGRIEARKNQLGILRVTNELGIKAVFIGALNNNHAKYCERFITELRQGRSEYLGVLPINDVYTLLRRSKVHVSASWFEVASLVDIEAYLSGCAVVSSICGSTNEVLGESAWYVNPDSHNSIRQAVIDALNSAKARSESQVIDCFVAGWPNAAYALSQAYYS